MIKFNEIKVGDYLIADNDGDKKQGEVTGLNNNEKQVCVDTGAQDFWYETDQLSAIPLDEDQLMKLKFHKHGSNERCLARAVCQTGVRYQGIMTPQGIGLSRSP